MAFNNEDEYSRIYRLNMRDEWIHGAYDERGEQICCDYCGDEMKFNPMTATWFCVECETEMTRAEYFNYIGADPPGIDCIACCCENYPICKRQCRYYVIDPNDPIFE